jgi:hypothetical protein
MTKRLQFPLHLTLLAVLVAGLLAWPRQAAAAGISVQPSTVSNTTSTTIVVTATDGAVFTKDEAVVVVDTIGALATTWVNTSTVTAAVPAGSPTGQFGVRVVDTTGTYAGATLTVTGPTNTPEPTGTPAPTAFIRPLLTVQSYGASSASLVANTDIDFEMTLVNSGQFRATNVSVTFPSGDLIPRVTGGVRAVGTVDPGGTARIFQPFRVGGIAGNSVATLEVNVAYTDPNGTNYTETFTLTFPVFRAVGGGPTSTPTPTPTARAIVRPQLLITAYDTDVQQLQPGARFTLNLAVQNLGSATAKRITMIAGGGSASDGPGTNGTPDPGNGGVSGSGGDFTNFAPVNASNVQSLGDLPASGDLEAIQTFVVNATTKAGAYPMKFSFIYADESGVTFTDDQVITLLVYQLPQVDVSFYRDPGPLFMGQPNLLPLQIVNLGRSSTVLGNMKVAGNNAEFANNVILVGALDPGGFFTLDAMVTPFQPGPLDLLVTVDYTDDFNQAQRITQTVTVEVMDMPVIDPGVDPGSEGPIEPPPSAPESLWQRVVRFVRGLFGLDSGVPPTDPGVFPGEGIPLPDDGGGRPLDEPLPADGPKG